MNSTPCPRCGFVETMSVKPMNNAMNLYVDEKTGKVDGAYNSEEVKLTLKDRVLVRKDKFVAPVATPVKK